jgi:hypothetical protein
MFFVCREFIMRSLLTPSRRLVTTLVSDVAKLNMIIANARATRPVWVFVVTEL